jgi:hypothetical protein
VVEAAAYGEPSKEKQQHTQAEHDPTPETSPSPNHIEDDESPIL